MALETSIDGNLTVNNDRELLAQALSNVVDNAIKYSAGDAEKPLVRVTATRTGEDVQIEISDNGPGIAPEDRARATERFVRLEKSRSQPGSGLGLSLAKAVMGFHRGSLALGDAEPGLRVTMKIPAQRGAA